MRGLLHTLKELVGIKPGRYQKAREDQEVERVREAHHEAAKKNVEAIQCTRNSARILDEVVDIVRGGKRDGHPRTQH